MSLLKVLDPIKIKDSMLVSSSVAEEDHAEWSSGSSYAPGNKVIRSSLHRVYQCIKAVSGANSPESDAASWVDIGPTNRWAMLDSSVSTKTTGGPSGLSVTIKPGRANGLALLDLVDVKTLSVTCSWSVPKIAGKKSDVVSSDYAEGISLTTTTDFVNGLVSLRYDINLIYRNVSGWTSYFTEPYKLKSDVFIGFASRSDIKVTLNIKSENPKVGAMMIGNYVELGDVQYGASAGIDDYSVKTTDEFGQTQLVERDYVKRIGYQLTVDNKDIARCFSTLAGLRAKPAVFSASSKKRFGLFTVHGFVSNFDLTLQFPTHSIVNIEVKGLK